MIFSKKNEGRKVKINGVEETILSVSANGESFRIASEQNNPVVNNYNEYHIQSAQVLTVSFNDGNSWIDRPFYE